MATTSEDILGSIGLMTIIFVAIHIAGKILIRKSDTSEEIKIKKLNSEVWSLKEKLSKTEKEKEEIRQFYSEQPLKKALKELDEWNKRQNK